MYQGAVADVPAYFAERGQPNPPNYNPADWIMNVAQTMSLEVLDKNGDVVSNAYASKTMNFEEWIRLGGIGRLTWSVLAAQTCRQDVDNLQRQKRDKIIEEYQELYDQA